MIDPFCLRLENLREKSGYTKKELSQKLGFSANVYGAYERGERRPSLETCCKLANLFNVSLDYLLCGKEYSQENLEIEETKLKEVIELFKEKVSRTRSFYNWKNGKSYHKRTYKS